LDYPPPVGQQTLDFILESEETFRDEIAPARTFGFVKDVEMLERMGMAEGGRLHNLILVDDEKIVNTELRFPDEFVRHKILDLIGDFYLLNRPVQGRVTACLTGHTENFALMKKIQEVARESTP
jgi:UDP-3-O-acyl-N-acetylglucosamine deacetylase